MNYGPLFLWIDEQRIYTWLWLWIKFHEYQLKRELACIGNTFILIFKYLSIYLLMGTQCESIVLTDLEVPS